MRTRETCAPRGKSIVPTANRLPMQRLIRNIDRDGLKHYVRTPDAQVFISVQGDRSKFLQAKLQLPGAFPVLRPLNYTFRTLRFRDQYLVQRAALATVYEWLATVAGLPLDSTFMTGFEPSHVWPME